MARIQFLLSFAIITSKQSEIDKSAAMLRIQQIPALGASLLLIENWPSSTNIVCIWLIDGCQMYGVSTAAKDTSRDVELIHVALQFRASVGIRSWEFSGPRRNPFASSMWSCVSDYNKKYQRAVEPVALFAAF